jgi:hypothetical protein
MMLARKQGKLGRKSRSPGHVTGLHGPRQYRSRPCISCCSQLRDHMSDYGRRAPHLLLRQQATALSGDHSCRPALRVQLRQDRFDVCFDGSDAEVEPARNPLVS